MIKRYALYEVPDGTADVVLYTDHIAEVCKLRDKLLELAAACGSCHGTGVKTEDGEILDDCPSCLDIREIL